jgi:hypothetical protein
VLTSPTFASTRGRLPKGTAFMDPEHKLLHLTLISSLVKLVAFIVSFPAD